jgi:excisionase family DNA binding protein
MQNNTQPTVQPTVLTITQVAKTLGLSRGKVYQLIRQENLPVVPFGRTMRIIPSSLNQWLKDRETISR